MNACPFCAEPIQIDLLLMESGDDVLDWLPCCEEAQAEVEMYGWRGFAGENVTRSVKRSTGRQDIVATTPALEGPERLALYEQREHVPGAGVKGWQAQVFELVDQHHQHHDRPQGWKFGVAVFNGRRCVGVAVVGRPVSKALEKAQPRTLEVTRVCTMGTPSQRKGAASRLYSLCATEARKLGADKIITYTLETESAYSVSISGFHATATTKGGSWDRASRPREDKAPTCKKTRWERGLVKATKRWVSAAATAFLAGQPLPPLPEERTHRPAPAPVPEPESAPVVAPVSGPAQLAMF